MKICSLLGIAFAAGLGSGIVQAQDPEIPKLIRRTQDPDVKSGGTEEEERAVERAEGISDAEIAEKTAEKGEPVVRADLNFYMAPVLSFQPRRIAPGATGEACLVLSMQQDAVLQPGALQLEYPRQQGPVTLGEWTIGEPAIGMLPGAFRGRPIYERYAKITIPIAVAPGTEHGRYPVFLNVIAGVTDGTTGSVRGDSRAPARQELEVGPPLPNPPAPVAHALPVEAAPGPDEGAAPDPIDDGALEPVEPLPVGASRAPTASSAGAAGTSPDADGVPPPAARSDDSLLWIGGGAVLLLGLIGLLATRKR